MTKELLLDTHTLLWWLGGQPLAREATELIEEPATAVLVSAASIWEIGIKRQVGKLRFEGSAVEEVTEAGFDLLPIAVSDAERAGDLPAHHRDPFDRMLVAQAQVHQLTLVTRNPAFDGYDVTLLRC